MGYQNQWVALLSRFLPNWRTFTACVSLCLSVFMYSYLACLPTYLSACQSVCLSTYLSAWLPICLSVHLSVSICVCVCQSICLSGYLSIRPFVCLACLSTNLSVQSFSACLCVCLSVSLSVRLVIYLSVCLSVCQSVCLSGYLFIWLSVYLSDGLSVCLSLGLFSVCLYILETHSSPSILGKVLHFPPVIVSLPARFAFFFGCTTLLSLNPLFQHATVKTIHPLVSFMDASATVIIQTNLLHFFH